VHLIIVSVWASIMKAINLFTLILTRLTRPSFHYKITKLLVIWFATHCGNSIPQLVLLPWLFHFNCFVCSLSIRFIELLHVQGHLECTHMGILDPELKWNIYLLGTLYTEHNAKQNLNSKHLVFSYTGTFVNIPSLPTSIA